ncbi:hypothetical protein I5677_12175 [Mobilitalea sibirica]|uniref:Uncharacterized protein n=1 Tax=Mobilitalea sibirica TaxID=1462919 RepID=A0A8J7KWR1_9FIRM|nr:hypothetical protein [Mobilitalea sibirica]MBH1941650.1 hypothetical protein [Mobilitalea sibirica]
MNKRQRKKQFKKKLQKFYCGFDFANGPDYTYLPDTVARFIYNIFNIPEEYMKEKARDIHLQYKSFLKMHRIVIGGD